MSGSGTALAELFVGITTGAAAFIATNIDDLFILMLFFAQMNVTFRKQNIIAGQYLGFTALIVASLPGYFGGLIVPQAWIGLLGLVPILMGLTSLIQREKSASEVQMVTEAVVHPSSRSVLGPIASLLTPQTYSVAAVTVANGGDNIGIYIPLFANSNLSRLIIILSVFFLLVGVWCYIALQLTRHPAVAKVLTRSSDVLVPIVLVGLGIFILIDNGTLKLLSQLI